MTPSSALEVATTVAAGAGELAQARWVHVSGAEAVTVAEAVATARSLLDAALLRAAERIQDTDAVREVGYASVKDYLTHLLGGHKGSGGGLMRALEQLQGLPAVQTALEAGRVTLPQARAIAGKVQALPRVPEFRERVAEQMLELVASHGHDASDLQASFSAIVRELDPESALVNADKEKAKRERGAHTARYLSFAEDALGGVRVTGYGTVEDAETIKTVLLPLSVPVTTEPGACGGIIAPPGTPRFDEDGIATSQACLDPGCGHEGRDPREAGVRMWDALLEACDRLRATNTLPRDHGTRPRVMVLIDHDSLQQRVIDTGHATEGITPTGARLSATAVRRLACDADLIPGVLGTAGQVLDVGRTQRLVTTALWTALTIRDQHCAFPSCGRPPLACDAHHILHWADGGTTDLDNLIMLCRHHHTLLHTTPWAVSIDPATRQPHWHPPPRLTLADLHGKMSYAPARPPGSPRGRAA